jgi:predicted MPP superfamily phosphohydrolase
MKDHERGNYMNISRYVISTKKSNVDLRLAVVSDLHARPFDKVIDALIKIQPDAILMPGDIVEIAAEYMEERNRNGLSFLQEASRIAPCYYCYGNHEIYHSHAKRGERRSPEPTVSGQYLKKIKEFGIHVVNDSFEYLEQSSSVLIGGLVCGREMDPKLNVTSPDLVFLKEYDKKEDFKILLCHYPHYYEAILKDSHFDLILSGHAHGGQWRFFGRGVYAPHQGLFPKYTSGKHDGRHIISRGCVNNARPIPRFFNPCEILEVRIVSEQADPNAGNA